MKRLSFIPAETINEIREKTDIVDVIGQYVQLTKRGNSYSCSCPFHEDRNPSFSIHSDKQIFKCFSCGRGGNVFTFLQEIEGISFPEAVQKAAEFSGVPLDPRYINQGSVQNERFSDLFEIHEKAATFYAYYLNQTNNGRDGLKYLTDRQIDKKMIERYLIGLAPENSEVLYQYLLKEGYSNQQLVNSGIFYQKDDQVLVDRFRGRVVFPLRNQQGKVVGFSGRIFGETQSESKYINSPETDIFQKNQLIFNLDLARPEIRRLKQAIVCEGFMDVIRMDQNGIMNSVATMGTSLTTHHLEQLTKMAQEIVFVFDGDDAGQNATNRAFELSLPFKNKHFKSVRIPNRMDPDEWLQANGGEALKQLIQNANNRFSFQREFLKTQFNLQDEQGLAQYIEKVIGLIAMIESPIEQQLRIQDIVKEYGIDEAIVKEQIARSKQHSNQGNSYYSSTNDNEINFDSTDRAFSQIVERKELTIQSKRAYEAEKLIIQNLIYHQDAWFYLEQHYKQPIFYHPYFQELFFKLEYYYYDKGLSFPMTGLEQELEDELQQLYRDIIWDARQLSYDVVVMSDCFKVIKRSFIEQEILEWKERLKTFQKEGRKTEVSEAMVEILRLTRQIKI